MQTTLPSTVRYRVERAPRRDSDPTMPGAPWRTVTRGFEDELPAAVEAMRRNDADPKNIYRVMSYRAR